MWKLNLSKIKKCSEWKIMRACIGIGNWNDQLRCSALSTGIPGSQESGVSQGIDYWEVFCLFSLSQSTRWQNCRRGVLLYSFHQQIGSLEHIRGLVRPFSSGTLELRRDSPPTRSCLRRAPRRSEVSVRKCYCANRDRLFFPQTQGALVPNLEPTHLCYGGFVS